MAFFHNLWHQPNLSVYFSGQIRSLLQIRNSQSPLAIFAYNLSYTQEQTSGHKSPN